jgi:hypothetical protein
MAKDNITDPKILYWIPKYILMRVDKPLSQMGFMSPQFKALANSQDIIGWRDFTEGHISKHFYAIQMFHLTMSSSYLNEEDWTKQFVSKILQLTHSLWIFRNISYHDKRSATFVIRQRMSYFSTSILFQISHRRIFLNPVIFF